MKCLRENHSQDSVLIKPQQDVQHSVKVLICVSQINALKTLPDWVKTNTHNKHHAPDEMFKNVIIFKLQLMVT